MENNNIKIDDANYTIKNINKKGIGSLKKHIIAGSLAGIIVISPILTYTGIKIIKNEKKYQDNLITATDITIAENDRLIGQIINNGIFVSGNLPTTINKEYYIKDDMLYHVDNEPVYLTDTKKPLYIVFKNVTDELLENIDLKNSKLETLSLEITSVNDDFINYLPSTLKVLLLNKCNFITNLNDLPEVCPNIEALCLNNMPMLNDFSFIYRLPNLKEVYIAESAYITSDLLSYLNNKHIKTNISSKDVDNGIKTSTIIESIIMPEMTDTEKIKAITKYVIDNMEYDISKTTESNYHPLTLALDTGTGVCSSYAYLTTILLNKAGINAYNIVNENHDWNIVELDDKYYRLDTTHIDTLAISKFMLTVFNTSNNYIDNPATSNDNSILNDSAIVSSSIANDILANLDDYHLQEKYKTADIVKFTTAALVAGMAIFLKSKIKLKKDTNNKRK